jgi:hypothetical protein
MRSWFQTLTARDAGFFALFQRTAQTTAANSRTLARDYFGDVDLCEVMR